MRLFSNKRPLRILLDFKSMNPHWLLQFPYAALIMIVYYCHSCMYFRKKSRELRESCGWKKRSMRIPPEITARIPAGGCFAARRKAGKEKKKMERRKMCWRRLLCLTLAALVLASCLTMTAFAADPQDSEENGIVDFVLVLDCSGSLNVTDPSHLCATACKMFVDMVPLENARISVIAFGYDGGTQYTLKNMSIDNPLDLKKVYLVSDMVEASAIKDKNASSSR